MPTSRFVAHSSPSKIRIFALAHKDLDVVAERDESLAAVTTLTRQDQDLADALLEELNEFLCHRDRSVLAEVLDRSPAPVRLAVEAYLDAEPEPAAGQFGDFGAIRTLREAYFSGAPDELHEYLSGAYAIGLGVRISNGRRTDGEVWWRVILRTEEGFVPASAQPRTWANPRGARVLRTLVAPRSVRRDPVASALSVLWDAADDGHWARAHTIERGDGESPNDGSTSVFVVDVFAEPIAADEES